ncbi:hypothetical protein P7F88_25595 [Vibrio hannami]|uniref:hypothetical protein n=1 Tax=Vibrio hannami TaxID=2717094 RepID=UPI002410812C|nr:hypothetical protein [Vibrio hannami]MDG3089241.1 hypothetical protein [Vibrio hannami]
MIDYGPWARIALRYVVGAGVIGSPQIGAALAQDPDLVMALSLAIGGVVEVIYVRAKKNGGKT